MPASEITTLLPRPRSVSGSSRDRANRTSARSSKTLWAVANRSAGPPTRIVVNRASGASRDVLTPIRRWMSARARRIERRRGGGGSVTRRSPRAIALDRWPARAAAGARRARGELGDRVGGPGPAERARGGGHRGVRGRVVEDRGGLDEGVASNASSATSRAAPASASTARSPAGGRRRAGTGTTTIGSPKAVTSASVDEPARPTTRSAAASAASMLVAQERVGPVARRAASAGSRSRAASAAA